MATLQIKKKSDKIWEHIDSELGTFIVSKFYFTADFNEFQIVEQGQSKRRRYPVANIEVFDIGGSAETFVNITQLSLRLEELSYVGLSYETLIINGGADDTADHYLGNWNASTNTPTLTNGVGQVGNHYKVSVAGTQFSTSWAVGDIISQDEALNWYKSSNNNQSSNQDIYMDYTVDGNVTTANNWCSWSRGVTNSNQSAWAPVFGTGTTVVLSTAIDLAKWKSVPDGYKLTDVWFSGAALSSSSTTQVRMEIHTNEYTSGVSKITLSGNQLLVQETWTMAANGVGKVELKQLTINSHNTFTNATKLFIFFRWEGVAGGLDTINLKLKYTKQ